MVDLRGKLVDISTDARQKTTSNASSREAGESYTYQRIHGAESSSFVTPQIKMKSSIFNHQNGGRAVFRYTSMEGFKRKSGSSRFHLAGAVSAWAGRSVSACRCVTTARGFKPCATSDYRTMPSLHFGYVYRVCAWLRVQDDLRIGLLIAGYQWIVVGRGSLVLERVGDDCGSSLITE